MKSLTFDKCIYPCMYHHNQDVTFPSPQKVPSCSCEVNLSLDPQATTDTFCHYRFLVVFSVILYKWKRFALFCAGFLSSSINVFEINQLLCVSVACSFLLLTSILLYGDTTIYLSLCLLKHILIVSTMNSCFKHLYTSLGGHMFSFILD